MRVASLLRFLGLALVAAVPTGSGTGSECDSSHCLNVQTNQRSSSSSSSSRRALATAAAYSGWTKATPITASLSTTYPAGATYQASNCIDGVIGSGSTCATIEAPPGANHFSIRVLAGTRVGYVAVYNRRESAPLPSFPTHIANALARIFNALASRNPFVSPLCHPFFYLLRPRRLIALQAITPSSNPGSPHWSCGLAPPPAAAAPHRARSSAASSATALPLVTALTYSTALGPHLGNGLW